MEFWFKAGGRGGFSPPVEILEKTSDSILESRQFIMG